MNDLKSYEILVREHEAMLFSYLLAFVRDRHLAEDLVQETFLQAYRKLRSLKKSTSFAAWVRTIGRNLALNAMKKRKREVPTDPEILMGIEDVFDALDNIEIADTWVRRARALSQCFDALQEHIRLTCKWYYIDGHAVKVVAEKLEANLATIRKRLERGRKSLRQCVEKRLELEGV